VPLAARPGTIPLRPLGLGDILDGAFRSIRFAPGVMFGLTAIIVLAMSLLQIVPVVLSDWQTGSIYDTGAVETGLSMLLSYGVSFIVSFVAITMLSGMLTYAVAQGAIGKRVTVASSWRAIGGRMPGLIGLTLLIGLMVVVAMLIPIGLMVVGGGMVGESVLTGGDGGIGPLLFLGGLLATLAAISWIGIRTLFGPAALVLEGQGVVAAVKHGWELSRGRFWRTLGIYLLVSLIAGFASSVVSMPLAIVSALTATASPVLAAISLTLFSAVPLILTTPFTAAVVALLYIDARMRAEGLDLALMQAAEDQPQ
jgi:hypothetical protein